MKCSICGKEVSAGEGYDTSIGFVCFDCYNARDFHICAECGRRFPRDEMVFWNGLYYCRSDYFTLKERYERIQEEIRKKKEEEEAKKRPPLVKPGAGIGVSIPRKKERVAKEELRGLIGELKRKESEKEMYSKFEKSRELKEGKEEKHLEESKDTDSILDSLFSLTSDSIDKISEAMISPLGDISLSKSGKKSRKDELSEALEELNSLLREKKRSDKS